MTDCRNAGMRDQLPLLAAGRLDEAARSAVDAHVAGCAECREELALIQRVRATTSRSPEVDVARIAAAVRGSARVTRETPLRRGASWGRWRIAAVAAAAALLALLAYDARTVDDPISTPESAQVARSVVPGDSLAVAAAGLSFGGGLADLSTDELEQLVAALDGFEALPSADPLPIAPEIPLELEGTL